MKDIAYLLCPLYTLMLEPYVTTSFIALSLAISIPLSHAINPSKMKLGWRGLEPEFRWRECKKYKVDEFS